MSVTTAPPPVAKRDAENRNVGSVVSGTGSRQHSHLASTLLTGYLPLIVATLVVAAPLVWMVLSSFKPAGEIVTLHPTLLPQHWTLENYRKALEQVPFLTFFGNSVLLTVIGAGVKVILAILTAYAFVYLRFPFKNVLFVMVLVALMVPSQVAILPNYTLISALKGNNTYWGILMPSLGTAFGTFLLRQQMKQIPYSMLEAASLDGASHWARLWRMVVPVSIPSIATVGLIALVDEWNNYLWPLIITTDPHKMTLPVGLSLLKSTENDPAGYGILMAGSVLVIIPVLIVFAFLQRYIVAGLTQGSVAN